MERLKFCLVLIVIPMTNGAQPGTFFWKPRLGIDLAIPTTAVPTNVQLPTQENVKGGLVVLLEGYEAGITIIAMAAGLTNTGQYPQMDPSTSYFYTNSYRWALRHFSLMPFWLGGNAGSYCHTHKIWKRRFFYMDEFVPKWLRYLFPYIKKEEWEHERKELRRFKKFSESAFGKHYRFPSKTFNDFRSFETVESDENLENSASSSITVD